MNEEKMIPVEQLHLCPENPRCLFVTDEQEALSELVRDQGGDKRDNKLLALAKDIAKYGLNKTELVMAKPVGNGYVVREGNRRVAAIKCIGNPSLLEEFSILSKCFSEIEDSAPSEILCFVTDDEDTIGRYIESRHNGQNHGVGTIPWNSEQRSRFAAQRSGHPDRVLGFIDQLVQIFGTDSQEYAWIGLSKKTNLERMLSTPYVRQAVGIESAADIYRYVGKNKALLSRFLERLSTSSVGSIYDVKSRVAFVDALLEEFPDLKQSSDQLALSGPARGNAESQFPDVHEEVQIPRSAQDSKSPSEDLLNRRPKGHQFERRTVAPQSGQPLHTEGRPHIGQIHRELKVLNADECPMACGLLLRTLVELVTDLYLSQKLTSIEYEGLNSRYSGRIQRACQELVKGTSPHISNNDADYLRKFAQNNDGIPVTLSSLSAIAHSESGWPDREGLVNLWDKIYPMVRAMLDYARE